MLSRAGAERLVAAATTAMASRLVRHAHGPLLSGRGRDVDPVRAGPSRVVREVVRGALLDELLGPGVRITLADTGLPILQRRAHEVPLVIARRRDRVALTAEEVPQRQDVIVLRVEPRTSRLQTQTTTTQRLP